MDGVVNGEDMEYCTQMDCDMRDCPHHPRNIPSEFEKLRARNMKGECTWKKKD